MIAILVSSTMMWNHTSKRFLKWWHACGGDNLLLYIGSYGGLEVYLGVFSGFACEQTMFIVEAAISSLWVSQIHYWLPYWWLIVLR